MTDPSTVTLLECSCGHLRSDHDSIAARFCDATQQHHLTRSCICKPVTPDRSGHRVENPASVFGGGRYGRHR